METNDTLGLGKVLPLDKLLDILSKAVGRVTKSYFDRKDVDTKAYEILKLAEANAKVKEMETKLVGVKDEKIAIISAKDVPNTIPETSQVNPTLSERTQERINFQEAKKQLNIENITAFAAEDLKNEPPVTDEPLDEDWTTRFFKIAEEISNEEMQALWGKILAGEIKQPKTFSLRTLELIRNLSQKEANTFKKVANFAIKNINENYLVKNVDNLLSEKYDINYTDIALLTEIGIIQSGEFVVHQLLKSPKEYSRLFLAGEILIYIQVKPNTPTINIPVHRFTNAGNELLNLIKPQPPFDYLTAFAHSIKNENIDVQYGDLSEKEVNGGRPFHQFK